MPRLPFSSRANFLGVVSKRFFPSLGLALGLLFPSRAYPETQHVEEMLFTDMGNILGVLTRQERGKTPAAISIISSEDIRRSSARNLMDLLETYVPGVMPWVLYHEGDHQNIRGLVSNKDDKWIFLVDGVDMVERGNTFSMFEQKLWDMNDIERVEVIRGPGSVTYGAGAITGVLNVVTKDAAGTAGRREAGAQHVGGYDSQLVHASLSGRTEGGLRSYLYVSGNTNRGVFPEIYKGSYFPPLNGFPPPGGLAGYRQNPFTDTGDFSRPSENTGSSAGSYAGDWNHYMADYRDRPNMKLHASLRTDKSALWFRYTQQGFHTTSGPFGFHRQPYPGEAESKMSAGMQLSKWHLVFEDDRPVTSILIPFFAAPSVENLRVKNTAMIGSYNVEMRQLTNYSLTFPAAGSYPYYPYSAEEWCMQCYSLDTLSGKSIWSYTPVQDRLELAAGLEYAYDHLGAGWGKDKNTLKAGDNNSLLLASPTTPLQEIYARVGGGDSIRNLTTGAPGPNAFAHYVGGDGFGVKRWSYLGEANAKVHPRLLNLILSGRQDDYSTDRPLFSPRLALVSDLDGVGVFKVIAQRSYRLPSYTTRKFLLNLNRPSTYEVIRDAELVYSPALGFSPYAVTVNGYYNDIDVAGYAYDSAAGTSKVGHLILHGAEIEVRRDGARTTWGFNHTYIKQKSFHVFGTPAYTQDVSMSQAQNTTAGGAILSRPTGNDLLRTPNHLTKLFGMLKTFDDKVVWQADSLINWGIPGNRDGIISMENGLSAYPDPLDQARVQVQARQIRDLDWYEFGLRLNASVSYESGPLSVTLFGQNLVSLGGNYRYHVSPAMFGGRQLGDANNTDVSVHATAIKEPLTTGLRIAYKL